MRLQQNLMILIVPTSLPVYENIYDSFDDLDFNRGRLCQALLIEIRGLRIQRMEQARPQPNNNRLQIGVGMKLQGVHRITSAFWCAKLCKRF